MAQLFLKIYSFFKEISIGSKMAEAQGFEPWRQFPDLPVFKTDPFNHLGKPPNIWWEKPDLN